MGKSMSSAGKCGKGVLVTINTLFLLAGLGCIAVGALVHVENEVFGEDKIIATLNNIEVSSTIKLGYLIGSLSIIMIVVGGFTFFIALLGCIGACCINRCAILVYLVILAILLVIQLTVVILLIIETDRVESWLQDQMTTVLELYEGIDSSFDESIGWDHMFTELECCGVRKVDSSNDQEFANCRWWASRGSDKVPKSCCNGATKANYKALGANSACTQTLTDNRQEGCYDAMKSSVFKYQTEMLAVAASLLFFELVGFIFGIVLTCAIKKSNKIY